MRSRCARYRWLQGLTITCRQTGCWNSAVRSYCRHRVRRRARHPPRRRPRPGSARRGGRAPGRPAHPARGDDPPGSENSCSVTYALNAEASSESQLEFDTVDVNRVLAAMDEAGNRVNLVILDACRDNPFARSFRSAASRGLAQMEAAKGIYIVFATAPGSVASEGGWPQRSLHPVPPCRTSGRREPGEQPWRGCREPSCVPSQAFPRLSASRSSLP